MLKEKELVFDMDGTLNDFYHYPDWLKKIRSHNVEPYAKAEHKYEKQKALFNTLINELKNLGFKVKVVSALPYSEETTPEFNKEIEIIKKRWLKEQNFPADEIYVLPYEEPKSQYSNGDLSILFDDNPEVREEYKNNSKAKRTEVVDANGDILKKLTELFLAEAALFFNNK